MTDLPRIAVVGAGLIGRRHAELVAAEARLDAIVDPSDAAQALALGLGAVHVRDLADYLRDSRPDGVILATPNRLHAEQALTCIDRGIPVLIEKPISDTTADAARIVEAAEAAGVPVLVGHHRRHNPLIAAAKSAIEAGRLGRITAVNALFWLYKPEDYFTQHWRRQKGAGPVFINLIHDIDLLRHLCGEIVHVVARQSSDARGFEVEDTAAILLDFANGALGTVTVSDTVVAPWSWEFAAGENPAYPRSDGPSYMIGGTHGSLSVPDMRLWTQPEGRSWWKPIASETLGHRPRDPLVLQIRHFADVIAGRAKPLVSGREGLRTLAVVEAIKAAAATGCGRQVDLPDAPETP